VRIQKLNGVRRLLKKLSFIFELPTRLKRTVELDASAEAVSPQPHPLFRLCTLCPPLEYPSNRSLISLAQVKYWRTALPVLRAYQHVPSFQAVEAEASEILAQLKDKLRSRLQSLDLAPAEVQKTPYTPLCVCSAYRWTSLSIFPFHSDLPSVTTGATQCNQICKQPRFVNPNLTP